MTALLSYCTCVITQARVIPGHCQGHSIVGTEVQNADCPNISGTVGQQHIIRPQALTWRNVFVLPMVTNQISNTIFLLQLSLYSHLSNLSHIFWSENIIKVNFPNIVNATCSHLSVMLPRVHEFFFLDRIVHSCPHRLQQNYLKMHSTSILAHFWCIFCIQHSST